MDLFGMRHHLNRVLHIRRVKAIHKALGIVSKDDLVFEIGSYDGMVGKALYDLGAEVVMVEPMPDMCEKIRRRFRGKDFRWYLEEAGIGKEVGKATLKICSNGMASTFSDMFASQVVADDKQTYEKTIEVKMITLETLIEKYGKPEYIKIDAEGYEWEILSKLDYPPNWVCFEFHNGMIGEAEKCIRHLDEMGGYEFYFTDWKSVSLGMAGEKMFLMLKSGKVRGGDVIAKRWLK